MVLTVHHVVYNIHHMPTYKYPRPSLTVDAVVFGIDRAGLKLLLIRRAGAPFKGDWALPGGFVQMNESLDAAALRELKEETGMRPSYLEQLYTFGEPKRDPRGRVISVAYFALVKLSEHQVVAASDAAEAKWFAVDELPRLAFDHRDVVDLAVRRLQAKVRYAPVGFELLAEEFTLSELQALYERILQRPLDKRNFRKKLLSMDLLRATGQKTTGYPIAELYRFDQAEYERLTKLGFNFEI
jgi:8-oxo-dGTP diphosphatase